MLDSMRALSKSLVSKLLMGLLVLSFGLWGVGDMIRNSGTASYAAKVGDVTIGLNEFQQARRNMGQKLEQMGMKGLPEAQLSTVVLRQLIQQKLTLLAVEDLGLYVNENVLKKTIADMPEFKGEDGAFSATKFKSLVDNKRVSERIFLGQVKRDTAGSFLADSLDMSDATPPASVLALESSVLGETRDVVLVTVPARDALDEQNEGALKKFYDENKAALYMTPERRTMEYVVLTDEDVNHVLDASITKEMIAEKIKAAPELNEGLARLKLRVEQRDEAMRSFSNTIEDELAAGKTMSEAFVKAGVKANAKTLTATAEMAKASENDIEKTVADQGFALSQGEISRLISSKKGALMMVTVKAVTAAEPKPFDEVKADVVSRLGKELAKDAAKAKAMEVKEALAKAPNWQAVTEEHKLGAHVLSGVARPAALEKADDSVPPALRMAIFERKVGDVAGPLSQPNGDQLLAYITASHLPKVEADALKPSKHTASMTQKLVQSIQNHAYDSFTKAHPVVMNPEVLKAPTAE